MVHSFRWSTATAQILSLLLLLGVFGSVQAAGQGVVMRDFDDSLVGFSFQRGELIGLKGAREFPTEIDFIFDMPLGLGTNNAELSKQFKGQGGIIDMGRKPLAALSAAPKSGYKPALDASDIKVGHSYYLRTADGRHHGVLHITGFDADKETLTFDWRYQP